MVDRPLVSVFCMCFNQAPFIIECLESIKKQTYPKIEVIISDDCSRDNSVELIEQWIENNNFDCTFVKHDKNKGICATLNELVSISSGEYICMVAADDRWAPNNVEVHVDSILDLASDYAVVYSNSELIDESSNTITPTYIEQYRSINDLPEGDIFDELSKRNWLSAIATIIRRECLDNVGLYDERLVYEDWDMWLRLALQYKFKYLPVMTTSIRIVSSSLTRTELHARSAKAEVSDFHVYEKMLQTGRLQPAIAELYKDKMNRIAQKLYRIKYPKRRQFIGTALKYRPSLRLGAMYILSLLGLAFMLRETNRA
ncbi:MAG: hypothetical protein CL946_02120 [Ectothiorhodospiraceae bacterium]|nr:hypothetical protein [Ectothiorhodospiraceae bacterium]